jgi:hypothetical protein
MHRLFERTPIARWRASFELQTGVGEPDVNGCLVGHALQDVFEHRARDDAIAFEA